MRTILAVLYVFLFLVLSIPVMLVEWIIGFFNKDLKDRSSFKIVRWAFRCVTFISGTKITVKGKENIPTDRAVLFIGNHRSIFYIVLVDTLMIRPTGFLAKKEIAKVPLLNVWIAFIHTLFLDRKDVKKGLQTELLPFQEKKIETYKWFGYDFSKAPFASGKVDCQAGACYNRSARHILMSSRQ